MVIESLRFKNIKIYGDKWQEIDFKALPTGLWLLKGRNGTGKTTILDILKIVLYFDLGGKTKKQIVNEINKKGAEIDIQIVSNNTKWRIHMGYSPDFIKLYKNDSQEAEDLGSLDSLKDFIKNQVSDIPIHIFRNTISLNIRSFKSFLSMKPEDARQIRDRLFNFYVLNLMLTKIKLSYKEKSDNIDILNDEISGLEHSVESNKAKIEEIRTDMLSKRNLEISECKAYVDKYSLELENLKSEALSKEADRLKLSNDLLDIELFLNKKELSDIDQLIHNIERDIQLNESIVNKNTADIELLYQELISAESNKILKAKLDKFEQIVAYSKFIQNTIGAIKSNIEIHSKLVEDYNTDIANNLATVSDIKNRLFSNKKYKEVYEKNDKCPTCNSDLHSGLNTSYLENLELSIKEDEDKLVYVNYFMEAKIKDKENSYLISSQNSEKLRDMRGKISDIKNLLDTITDFEEISTNLLDFYNNLGTTTDFDFSQTEILIQKSKSSLPEQILESDIKTNISEIKNASESISKTITIKRSELSSMVSKKSILSDKTKDKNLESDVDPLKLIDIQNSLKYINQTLESSLATQNLYQKEITHLNSKISVLEDISDINKAVEDLTKISSVQELNISTKKEAINKLLIEKYEDSILLDIVSDSGIKAFILQQIIPAINNEVSRNLPKFDVNGNIAFNAEFKPTFYRNGITVDFDSFSDGTRAKMDICTLISIIKTIKSKYNDINVIFLDEVLSSIDVESRDHIIGTIKQICCDELKMHTFICNHSEIPSHHFDYKLSVTNDGNFSDINIETL